MDFKSSATIFVILSVCSFEVIRFLGDDALGAAEALARLRALAVNADQRFTLLFDIYFLGGGSFVLRHC